MGAAFDREGDRRRHGSRAIGSEGKPTETGWLAVAGDEAKVGRESAADRQRKRIVGGNGLGGWAPRFRAVMNSNRLCLGKLPAHLQFRPRVVR